MNEQQLVPQSHFVSQVKKWVLLDSQLKMVQEKVKTMREEKHALGSQICEYLEKTGASHRKIMIHDGNLKVYEKKEYSPLTFGFLEQHLGKIMNDPNQVDYVIQFLKEQREIKTTNDLKRSYKNVD
tara:strand:- start:5268 stop:5645 length:378 start_codon:yes stop_codon:yes gene_type:complete